MKLEWLGHSCFKLTNAAGGVLITDPFAPSVGYPVPKGKADIVTMSHHHHDHDFLGDIGADNVLDTVCDSEIAGFHITSMMSFHDDCGGSKRGNNLLFKFVADGQTVIHLGDLGHFPTEEQLAFLADADVMLIPVGGFFTIDTDTALRIVKAAAPKAVIPMHFNNSCCKFPISDEKKFVSALDGAYAGSCTVETKGLTGCTVLKYPAGN